MDEVRRTREKIENAFHQESVESLYKEKTNGDSEKQTRFKRILIDCICKYSEIDPSLRQYRIKLIQFIKDSWGSQNHVDSHDVIIKPEELLEYEDDPDKAQDSLEAETPQVTLETDGPQDLSKTEKPQMTLETDKPQGPSQAVKPQVTPEIDKPQGTPKIDKQQGTPEIDKPQGTPEIDKHQGTSEINKPKGPSEIDKPKDPSEIDKPQSSPEIDKQQDTQEIDKRQGPSEIDKPKGSSEIDKPKGSSEIDKPQGSSEIDKHQGTSEIDKPECPSEIDKPNGSSEIDKHQGTSEIDKPECPSEIDKPNGSSEIDKPQGTSKTDKHQVTSEIDKHQGTSEIDKPECPSEIDKPNGPSEIDKSNGLLEIDKPHGSSEIDKPQGSSEVDKPQGSSEVDKPHDKMEIDKTKDTPVTEKLQETSQSGNDDKRNSEDDYTIENGLALLLWNTNFLDDSGGFDIPHSRVKIGDEDKDMMMHILPKFNIKVIGQDILKNNSDAEKASGGNLMKNEVKAKIKEVQELIEKEKPDVFICVVSTHGMENLEVRNDTQPQDGKDKQPQDNRSAHVVRHQLCFKDGLIKQPMFTDELIEAFDDDRCPELKGKPRLFFIQACSTRMDKDSAEGLDEGAEIGVLQNNPKEKPEVRRTREKIENAFHQESVESLYKEKTNGDSEKQTRFKRILIDCICKNSEIDPSLRQYRTKLIQFIKDSWGSQDHVDSHDVIIKPEELLEYEDVRRTREKIENAFHQESVESLYKEKTNGDSEKQTRFKRILIDCICKNSEIDPSLRQYRTKLIQFIRDSWGSQDHVDSHDVIIKPEELLEYEDEKEQEETKHKDKMEARGRKPKKGDELKEQTPPPQLTAVQPLEPYEVTPGCCFEDCLVMFASPPGKTAFGREKDGGWLISALFEEFKNWKGHPELDLLDVLTKVNSNVCKKQTNLTGQKNKYKTVSCIHHKLTKDVRLIGKQ